LENPLLRCGLAFAGANHAESVKEGEDGLATAMEIAGLDLQGTDLVTLSACLTGFGELRSGEGVYPVRFCPGISGLTLVIFVSLLFVGLPCWILSHGVNGLHRSFLLAGAKTVLASLWSVPDLETKDLMVDPVGYRSMGTHDRSYWFLSNGVNFIAGICLARRSARAKRCGKPNWR
jgi:CHAT domain-containing protein